MAQEIEKSNALGVSTSDVINFGSNSLIDLTGMPPEQIAELKRQYASRPSRQRKPPSQPSPPSPKS